MLLVLEHKLYLFCVLGLDLVFHIMAFMGIKHVCNCQKNLKVALNDLRTVNNLLHSVYYKMAIIFFLIFSF